MKVKDRQKICSHCEGRIAVEADTCLYCGMPLVETEKTEGVKTVAEGLYPPPYSQRTIVRPQIEEEASSSSEEVKTDLLPLLFALLGSLLFVLGLMQGFFSEGGVLRLEWNSKYWFAFCLTSLPLFYLSLRKMSKGESRLP